MIINCEILKNSVEGIVESSAIVGEGLAWDGGDTVNHLYLRLYGMDYKVERASFRVDQGELVRIFPGHKPDDQNYVLVDALEILDNETGESAFTYLRSSAFKKR